jgi:hypothetical protein
MKNFESGERLIEGTKERKILDFIKNFKVKLTKGGQEI